MKAESFSGISKYIFKSQNVPLVVHMSAQKALLQANTAIKLLKVRRSWLRIWLLNQKPQVVLSLNPAKPQCYSQQNFLKLAFFGLAKFKT